MQATRANNNLKVSCVILNPNEYELRIQVYLKHTRKFEDRYCVTYTEHLWAEIFRSTDLPRQEIPSQLRWLEIET